MRIGDWSSDVCSSDLKRNGFKMPLRYTPRLIADLALHPCWCWQILRHGSPQLKNLARSSRMPKNIAEQAAALSRQMDLTLTWDDQLGRASGRGRGGQ